MGDVCGIYQILNKKNGKRYIGLSKHCNYRMKQHIRALNSGNHSNIHLQAAWDKYGGESFIFNIIEKAPEEVLPEREIYWISYYDAFTNGYNRSAGGDGTTLVSFSPERNKQISKALSGKDRPWQHGSRSPKARKVVCLNTGKYFDCAIEAANYYSVNYTGLITSCKRGCTVGNGLVFMYEEQYAMRSDENIQSVIRAANLRRRLEHTGKAVVCLNTQEVFSSSRLACERYDIKAISSIHNCCKGKTASAGVDDNGSPLAWMYYEDYNTADKEVLDEMLRRLTLPHKRNIAIRCRETNVVYPSIAAASTENGINHTTLSNHLKIAGYYKKKDPSGIELTFELAN